VHVFKQLSVNGEVLSTISVHIKHDVDERKYLRPDGLQRDAVHSGLTACARQ
jgi:hypothetical protein